MTTATKVDRTTFRTSRLLDFCSEKELVAQTGHRREAWPMVVLKELVDNALDACEEAGTAPDIVVKVDKDTIAVSDNGPGLPAETVKGVLDFSVRVSSREAYVAPTRGAQGNALKTVIAMPFVLDGEEGRVEISTRGEHHKIMFGVDRIRQEPVVNHCVQPAPNVKNGTWVRLLWPDSACSILADSKWHFLQVAEAYAWLNPHLTLTVWWNDEEVRFGATDPGWRKWLPSDATPAHWYRSETLERLIAAYLAHDLDHGRDRTAREFIREFRGLAGSARQKAVLEETGLSRQPLSSLCQGDGLDRHAVTALLDSMKAATKSVKPQALGVIGKDHFRSRCEAAGAELETFAYWKRCETSDGMPWVLETAFAWVPDRTDRLLVTGVNWSPAIVNPFRELGHRGESLDSLLVDVRAGSDEPVIVFLHLASPGIEYTDRGKSAVVLPGNVTAMEQPTR